MSYSVLNRYPTIPVVANVPHSSAFIPEDVREQFVISEQELHEEQRRLVDWFTDDLYAGIIRCGGCVVRHDVSRFVLDPERFEDDAEECMAKQGMGVIYTHGYSGKRIRRELSLDQREDLLNRYYRPYHAELIARTEEVLERFGRCIVIDCHSYPAAPLPYELDGTSERADVVLGTDKIHTPQSVTALVERLSLEAGYSFGIDRPFAGTYLPLPLYRDPRLFGFMFEINRATYMNEVTTECIPAFDKMEAFLERTVRAVSQLAL